MPDHATLAVAPRYTRAVHIRRDFRDLRYRLDGYQVTALVRQAAARVLAGLAPGASERAFSIVGPFGSGKSAFGLFLAHYLQRSPKSRRQLLGSLGATDAEAALWADAPTLLAVLVPGNNSALRHAVLESLHETLTRHLPRGPAAEQLLHELDAARQSTALDPQRVAELLGQAARLLRELGLFQGVLLLIDELGQFLDFAARHDEERDLFVLQALAEQAARSGAAPCVVVTILHQAFERYSLNAGAARRSEWAKVQGRFADLAFQEPARQMIRMGAHAMRPPQRDPYREARAAWAAQVAPAAEALGLRPVEISADDWRQIVADCYPLHPSVLVALPTLFRQLAQNERSLFAFLHADEPWGLRDALRDAARPGALPIYRLTQLCAYVEATLGPGLYGRARGQRWAELAEARALLAADDPLAFQVLTVVGTIGALERSSGLRASAAQVAFALADATESADAATVRNALDALRARRMLAYRQHRDSYIIWEGSDLDLDELAREARRELGERVALPALLQRHANATPRIARRHSYRTGATRTFAVRYVDVGQLAGLAAAPGYDGELLHIVPADEDELAQAAAWASASERATEPQRIVVLPQRVRELRDVLLDVAALSAMLDERPELERDRVARREVGGRLIEAQQALSSVIAQSYGGARGRWFHRNHETHALTARQIDALLSDACDATYPQTPHIWNELIVRRQLSSAAAKARRNLVEAMLERAGEEQLGIVGYPPERAIYESVLRAGGLHRQDEAGQWRLGPPPPDDPLGLHPAWAALEQLLEAERPEPLPLSELLASIERAPFGIKAGLTPLLFVALYAARAGELSLYERGSYVPLPDLATFERLLARPEPFALRLSRADGARRLVYERLANALAPRALSQPVQPALLAVALPLLRMLRGLPEFSRQTRQVSEQAQALRRALREARAPDELLFERLPVACGLPPFRADEPEGAGRVDAFATALRESMQELQAAYPRLLQRLAERIGASFGLRASGAAARAELQARHAAIAETTNDPQLRALGVRLETADADDEAWVESVAALVARRPPELWADADLPACEAALAELGRRLRTAEELALAAGAVPSESPLLRIGLASGRGELSRVLHTAHDDPAVLRLRAALSEAMGRHGELTTDQQAAALAALLAGLLEPGANRLDREGRETGEEREREAATHLVEEEEKAAP